MVAASRVISTGHKILCDLSTFKMAQRYFSFQELNPIQVKGKENLLHIFQPLLQKTKPQIAPGIIGRRRR
jgi:hypothetical protein